MLGSLGLGTFRATSPPRDRQVSNIEQSRLHKRGGLIPIDMFMGQLLVAEVRDDDNRDLHLAVGARIVTPSCSVIVWA